MTKNLYDTLGVNKGSSKEDIKKAYRKKANEHHPDKGGDSEKMTEITKAYSILGDDKKRSRYDSTGETEAAPFDRKFQEFIQKFLMPLVETTNVDSTDIIAKLVEIAKANISGTKAHKSELNKKLKKLNVVIMRLESKGEDRIGVIVNGNIDVLKREIATVEEHLEFMGQVLECLGGYEYNYDPAMDDNGFMIKWNNI